ncbi:hypothetical protein [Cellulomonas sp. URHE0023]|uniref:hypothetical protein n=1 Tax=Cellulomonas sp. URHE0023 TaxID=1380354 RepID=UPI000480C795|nr:hypothetical protein [Cellulomonas sp. URHE0023]
MRWEQLFADMEAQLAAGRLADLRADVSELARAERGSVMLSARLRASVGQRLRVRVEGGEPVDGTVLEAAPEWLLLAAPARRALVPLAAVAAVEGLATDSAPPPGVVESRLGLGQVLRALSRDRVGVRVAAGGSELIGRIDRVGADHLDVVELGTQGRASWSVPFERLRVVHEA